MGQKYSTFEKNDFQIPPPLHCLTDLLENLDKGTSQECKKFDLSQFLNFSFFALSKAQKLAQFSIFAIFSATHSQKGKIHNILPLSFLHLREIPFSKFSSKMVRQLKEG